MHRAQFMLIKQLFEKAGRAIIWFLQWIQFSLSRLICCNLRIFSMSVQWKRTKLNNFRVFSFNFGLGQNKTEKSIFKGNQRILSQTSQDWCYFHLFSQPMWSVYVFLQEYCGSVCLLQIAKWLWLVWCGGSSLLPHTVIWQAWPKTLTHHYLKLYLGGELKQAWMPYLFYLS